MTVKRVQQRLEDYAQVLDRLKEALQENPDDSVTVVDGTIQRFEFCFELAWKLAKDVLALAGVEAKNPRMVIKESFNQNFIANGDVWLTMLDDRNSSVHTYDQELALKIYNAIKGGHVHLLQDFLEEMKKQIEKLS